MINISILKFCREGLEERYNALLLADLTKDKRQREKRISQAKREIADFASKFPMEVKVHLEISVGGNALHYQHVDNDIERSIQALDAWINSMGLLGR